MSSASFSFDPFSPEYEKNPHPICLYLRENHPAFWWAEGPAWLFTRYEDAVAILKDRRISSDPAVWEHGTGAAAEQRAPAYQKLTHTLLFGLKAMDHARVRGLVGAAFGSRAVERMRASVEAIVAGALPDPDRDGTFDIVHDYAAHIPIKVICSMLGIPAAAMASVERFGSALLGATNPRLTPDEKAARNQPIAEGVASLRELIEERRKRPGDDLLSALVAAEQQGGRLSHDELIGLVASLIAAGMETTMQHICYSVFHLVQHPDQLRFVQQAPALMRNAVEEVLRYDFFARTGPSRFATQDLEIRGARIRKGQMVLPMLVAAMRDPAAFPDPDRFDVRRDQTRNIAFGGGPHYCTGANLARLQVEIAVAALFRRFPRMRIASERRFAPDPIFRSLASLRIAVR